MVDLFVRQMQYEFEISMVGELNFFLGFQIRGPDIAYSVGVCARYQANPKASHLS